MSLFDAPKDAVLVHACNAQGVWGSGIAVEFKKRYPMAYVQYQDVCQRPLSYQRTGYGTPLAQSVHEQHRVGILITSENYGKLKDSVEQIKINTTLALDSFCTDFVPKTTIYSNKFNSGLFGVPWEDTELILKTILKRHPNITWIVCDPEHVDG